MVCERIIDLISLILNFPMNCFLYISTMIFGENYDKLFGWNVPKYLDYDQTKYKLIKIFFMCRHIFEALYQRFKERPEYTVNPEHIKNKRVVITDCNSAYGRAITRVMIKNGAQVIAGCKEKDTFDWRPEMMEAQQKSMSSPSIQTIVTLPLDLTSQRSIELFAQLVSESFQTIDILICNACHVSTTNTREMVHGFGADRDIPESAEILNHGKERHFAANHLGHFVLTHLLLDRLKACANARVIVDSSASYIFGPNSVKDINVCRDYTTPLAYFQSKLANILFVREFARLVAANASVSKIKIYCVDSESVSSQLGFFYDMGLPWIERLLYLFYYPIVHDLPQLAAQTTLYFAFSARVKKQSGYFYSNCRRVDTNLSDSMAEELWKNSCEWAKIDFKL